MRIVSRYLLRQIAAPSLLALTAIAVVGVSNEIQERIKKLPVAQMTFGDVTRLALYFLPSLAAYVVPITYMMGILLAFSRLAQRNEIVAMKAAGIPLKRMIGPVIVVGAFLSALCFVVQDRVQPWAIGKVYDLIYSDLPLRVTFDVLPTGIMQEYGGWRVYIGRRDPKTRALENIVIVKPEEGGSASAYYADSARIVKEGDETWLAMANLQLIPPGESGYVTMLRGQNAWLSLPRVATDRPPVTRRERTLAELFADERALKEKVETTHSEPVKLDLLNQRREIASRLSLPFACLAVTLAAAPLGARAKRAGKSYTFAVGFIIIVLYYVLQMLMEPRGLYPLWVGVVRAWLPNFVLCGAGVGFVWTVDRV